MKYIDSEKLKAEIKRRIELLENGTGNHEVMKRVEGVISAYNSILRFIDSLQQEQEMGEVSDGYHTFNELYYYRMLYNAAFFNLLPEGWVHKSKRHHTGEECFGGGWFIVMANLPTGQVSNHYELKDWDLFKVPEKEFADEWDGHTPQEAAKRLYEYLQWEQPEVDLEKEIDKCWLNWISPSNQKEVEGVFPKTEFDMYAHHFYELGLNARKEESK
ncbi:hypothetical protein [Selenomonas ruminantium]|uniref:WDGH domain-containing protein n=1 Tax=Selenomonas ruminantium TaxID=971 RepID=UPI0026ED401B|nr:hypothetical protein [Selenomonas ruminantium]